MTFPFTWTFHSTLFRLPITKAEKWKNSTPISTYLYGYADLHRCSMEWSTFFYLIANGALSLEYLSPWLYRWIFWFCCPIPFMLITLDALFVPFQSDEFGHSCWVCIVYTRHRDWIYSFLPIWTMSCCFLISIDLALSADCKF